MVILSIGVRPNGDLAKNAGLEINKRGGIVVNDQLQTSDPAIYAIGDAAEVKDFITGGRTMIPLAGPANKQGRIVAGLIAGEVGEYSGTQGSSIVQVFGLTAASTGLNERTLQAQGLKKGTDYHSLIIVQNSHAGYFPGAVPMTIKLLFSADGKKIFGAQIIGKEGVDKRIDTIGVAIRLGADVAALTALEFAYAPPYSSAKDPVNMAGFTAENILTGKVRFAEWDELDAFDPEKVALVDVREMAECDAFVIPGATVIPLAELRQRLQELDPAKPVITMCAAGIRGYNAARILENHGFRDVKVYPGGMRFYKSTHYQEFESGVIMDTVSDSGHVEVNPVADASFRLDCSGMQCPGPIMKVFETIKSMQEGQLVEVTASDTGFSRDIVAWCKRTGNTLVSTEDRRGEIVAVIRKGVERTRAMTETRSSADGKTIIVFSGDLDRVLASFIIANGAAAMGRPVTMFFTFWGLNVLRKSQKQAVKKTLIESMFGWMMPRGVEKLTLSRMNMGGMGTAMMKKVMQDKNVDSLETLMTQAMKAGVKLVACTMSMDVMGIKAEELIEGVELGGVGAYLGDAEESDVNLFI